MGFNSGFKGLNIKMCIISYESARHQRGLRVTPELWSLFNVAFLAPKMLRWFFIFLFFFFGGGEESVEPWAKHLPFRLPSLSVLQTDCCRLNGYAGITCCPVSSFFSPKIILYLLILLSLCLCVSHFAYSFLHLLQVT